LPVGEDINSNMKSSKRILVVAIGLFLVSVGSIGAQTQAAPHPNTSPAKTTSFAPFEHWKAAVKAGDQSSLASLYSANPPAMALIGKTQLPNVEDEWRFWAGLKAEGLTEFTPKILSIVTLPDETRLVLRVQAAITRRTPADSAQNNPQNIVASMVQVWVRQADGWHIRATQRSNFFLDAGRRLPEPAKPNPALYPDPKEAPSELKAASARAARENKRVLVIFGANWCYDCHVLDATFHSKAFAPLVQANYVVLHINIGDEGKDNNDIAARLGANLDRGVPSVAVLDPDGKVVVAQRNGEFESTMKIGPEDVRAFLEKWKPVKK
jgi:thioredoxin 1